MTDQQHIIENPLFHSLFGLGSGLTVVVAGFLLFDPPVRWIVAAFGILDALFVTLFFRKITDSSGSQSGAKP